MRGAVHRAVVVLLTPLALAALASCSGGSDGRTASASAGEVAGGGSTARSAALQSYQRQALPIAEGNDGFAAHVLHHEVRTALRRRAGVEHLRNCRVRHDREGLAFGLEAGDDLRGVHARLDDLQRHLAADGTRLFGEPDFAHAARANALKKTVRADDRFGVRHHRGLSVAPMRSMFSNAWLPSWQAYSNS